jgi:hypothetical protein
MYLAWTCQRIDEYRATWSWAPAKGSLAGRVNNGPVIRISVYGIRRVGRRAGSFR